MTTKTARFSQLPVSYRSLILPVGLLLAGALAIRPLGAATESPDLAPVVQSVVAEAVATPSTQAELPAAEAVAVEPKEVVEVVTTPLRRLRKKEITRDIALRARDIIHDHHNEPFGTEIEFESAGDTYVARIEEHYHPPGGEAKPWGHHPGVSVLVRRPLPAE